MKSLTATIALIISTIFLTVNCGSNDESKSDDFVLAAGYKTGNYYKFSLGLKHAMKKAWGKDVSLTESAGSYENLKKLLSGKADLALAQEDVLESIKTSPANKEDVEISAGIDVICVSYLETVHVLVNTNKVSAASDADGDGTISSTDIRVTDLSNKTVNIGEPGSGSYITAENVLSANQVSCTVKTLPSREGVTEVVNGTCDAAFYTTGLPNEIFEGISKDAPVTLIKVTLPHTSNIYTTGRISSYDYAFLHNDISDTLQVRALLVTLKEKKMPDLKKLFRYLELTEKSKEFDNSFPDKTYNTVEYYSRKYSPLWAGFSIDNTLEFFHRNPQIVNSKTIEYLFPYYTISESPEAYFSTGTASGSYTKAAEDLLSLQDSSGKKYIQLEKLISTGSFQNVSSIYNSESSMAIVQDDVIPYLVNRISDDESLKVYTLKKIMPLYKEYVHVIVNKTAKIASLDANGNVQKDANGDVIRHASQTIRNLEDLKGLNVCLCEKTSGSFISGINLMFTYNFDQDDAPTYYFDSPEVAAVKVASGEYDAMIKVTASNYSLLTNSIVPVFSNGAQVSGLDDDALNDASYLGATGANQSEKRSNFTASLFLDKISLVPALKKSTSPLEYSTGQLSYGNLGVSFETTCVRALLVAHPSFNDKNIGDFIDSVFQNKSTLTNILSTKDEITKTSSVDYFKSNPRGWSDKATDYYLKNIQ